MEITSGKIQKAIKTCVYGPEGIGKSTFAAAFPDPIFCDTEDSTVSMDVRRTPKPTSWMAILEQVRYFIKNPHLLKTFVLDTADWAERLCIDSICAKSKKEGIEDFGYGKGYVYLSEEFGKLLNLLSELVDCGVNVVITAHAKMRKFEQPDEMGAYDRWEMKLGKNTAPLLKEWADMVLFASYRTYVINVDGQGTEKGKNKAQGGDRVLRTSHHPCWDAKNRHNLPAEMPFNFSGIAHLFTATQSAKPQTVYTAPNDGLPVNKDVPAGAAQQVKPPKVETPPPKAETPPQVDDTEYAGIPRALQDLMKANGIDADHPNGVTPFEIQFAVAKKGYYPQGTPIANYDPGFVIGVLVGAWPQVLGMILKNREETPF